MATDARRPRVLVGLCGSVACVKGPEIVNKLARVADVRIVRTSAALKFQEATERYDSANATALREAVNNMRLVDYTDQDEWNYGSVRDDPVLHIELRKWADLFLIAPLSANTLGKLANGICDNLLTCVARAWDVDKPLVLAPAMNTHMWDHPLTSKQLAQLVGFGATVIDPVVKTLACSDTGSGALATVDNICAKVLELLGLSPDAINEEALEPSCAFRAREFTPRDKMQVSKLFASLMGVETRDWEPCPDFDMKLALLSRELEPQAVLVDKVLIDPATQFVQAFSATTFQNGTKRPLFVGFPNAKELLGMKA
mmetsp:Transcript_1950/g.6081  ORF Transcript_1950/g.6081 Transcript_1950/m.6081 type:complete len:313 (-) Transcript_1950:475-1413(-)